MEYWNNVIPGKNKEGIMNRAYFSPANVGAATADRVL